MGRLDLQQEEEGSSVCQASGSISLISTYSPFKMRCTSLGGSCGTPRVVAGTGIAGDAVPVARGRGGRDGGAAADGPRALASSGAGTGAGDENTGMNEGAIIPTGERGWLVIVHSGPAMCLFTRSQC